MQLPKKERRRFFKLEWLNVNLNLIHPQQNDYRIVGPTERYRTLNKDLCAKLKSCFWQFLVMPDDYLKSSVARLGRLYPVDLEPISDWFDGHLKRSGDSSENLSPNTCECGHRGEVILKAGTNDLMKSDKKSTMTREKFDCLSTLNINWKLDIAICFTELIKNFAKKQAARGLNIS